MRLNIRCAAKYATDNNVTGMGRVYSNLVKTLKTFDDCELTRKRSADVQLCIEFPYRDWRHFNWYARERHETSVLYTTWETTRLPDWWVEVANTFAAVFVPSTFNKRFFEESGIEVPIHVVPHGVNAKRFKYMERDWNSDPFVFLWQGMHVNDRKGMWFAEEAFKKASMPNAILIEKIYPDASKEMPIVVPKMNGRIQQIRKIMPMNDYLQLMNTCHVSVNPYRGEGFGLMPMECASTGMATMATDWSGPIDYLNDSFWRIKYRLCEPGEDYINSSVQVDVKTQPAQDAIPDVDDIVKGMRYFYDNRNDAEDRGLKASKHVARYTWKNSANKLIEALHETLEGR